MQSIKVAWATLSSKYKRPMPARSVFLTLFILLTYSLPFVAPGANQVIGIGDSLTAGVGGNGVTWPAVLSSLGNVGTANQGLSGWIPRHVMYYYLLHDSENLTEDQLKGVPPNEYENRINQPDINNLRTFITDGQTVTVQQGSGYVVYRWNATSTEDDTNTIKPDVVGDSSRNPPVPTGRWILQGPGPKPNALPPICVIWLGANGMESNDLATSVSTILASYTNEDTSRRFLLLGLFNRLYYTSGQQDINDWATWIGQCNSYLQAAYPHNYLDLQSWFTSSGPYAGGGFKTTDWFPGATAQQIADDQADQLAGLVPRSLRAPDNLTHLNATGYTIVGNLVYSFLTEKGWLQAPTVTNGPNPLVELDFNDGSGSPSLTSRGMVNATGSFTDNATYSTNVPWINGGGYSGVFGGTGDRVNFGSVPAFSNLVSFTIVGWVNFTSQQSNSSPRVASYRINTGSAAGFDLILSGATSAPKLQLAVDGTLATDTNTLTYSNWIFVAVSYDGTKTNNNVQFYIGDNGSLAATSTQTCNRGVVDYVAGQILLVGGVITTPTDGIRDFAGNLDGIQIYGSSTDDSGVLTFDQLDSIRRTPDCNIGTWRSGYSIYNPTVQLSTVWNSTSHDATIIYFDNKWIAQWDDGTEAVGQKIRQSTSDDLVTWTAPIEVYSSTNGSINPISDTIQWQPSLTVVGNSLFSVFSGANNNTWFSKLNSSSGKWTNLLLFGSSGAKYGLPSFDGTLWSVYPGNNGIVLQSGRVVVPVTLTSTAATTNTWIDIPKRDSVISTDDGGATWACSPGVTYGTNSAQCWEATVWEPASNVINMLARNNRSGTALSPLENIKYSSSTDGGATWGAESLFSQDFALSRPHVVRIGARNILAQNDWSVTTDQINNRRNLSLFFSRGNRNDDFVAGLNFTVADGPVATTRVDYPQIGYNGNTAAVIYTKFTGSAMSSSITKVAEISPLPDDSSYYIFPRVGYNPVDAVTVDNRQAARFHDNFSSAGIDIDSNAPGDSFFISFFLKPETSGRQCVFNLSNGVKLFSNNGRLTIKKWDDGEEEIDCGSLPVGAWTLVEFFSGEGRSMARASGGGYTCLPIAPYPWKAYFGDNVYDSNPPKSIGQTFLIDLASVNTMVKPRRVIDTQVPAYISAIEPTNGQTRVISTNPFIATIVNQVTDVNTNTLRLTVNGVDVTAAATMTATTNGWSVAYVPVGGWEVGTQQVELTFQDDGTPPNTSSNAWSFVTTYFPTNSPGIFQDAVLSVTFVDGNPNDISPNASPALVTNNITYTTDLPPMPNSSGYGAVFNGVNSYISYGLGNGNVLQLQTNLTYYIRVKFNSFANSTEQWLMGRFANTANRVSFLDTFTSPYPRILGGASTDGGSYWGFPYTTQLGTGVFYDVFLRIQPGSEKVDVFNAQTGANVSSVSLTTTNTSLFDSTSPLEIGSRADNPSACLNGVVAQMDVWSRTLSDSEVTNISYYGASPALAAASIQGLQVVAPGMLELRFAVARTGESFTVQETDSLSNPVWTDVNDGEYSLSGDGTFNVQFPAPTSSARFYRIVAN